MLSLLFSLAFALPNGAPKCLFNSTVVTAAHGTESNSTLGYSLKATVVNNMVEISLQNPYRTNFKGILMYVISGNDTKVHYGEFQLDTSKFKHTDPSICQAANVTSPGTTSNMHTFTHANPTDKDLATTKFLWKPTGAAGVKDLVVRCVVATGPTGGPKNTPMWQFLQPLPLTAVPNSVAALEWTLALIGLLLL